MNGHHHFPSSHADLTAKMMTCSRHTVPGRSRLWNIAVIFAPVATAVNIDGPPVRAARKDHQPGYVGLPAPPKSTRGRIFSGPRRPVLSHHCHACRRCGKYSSTHTCSSKSSSDKLIGRTTAREASKRPAKMFQPCQNRGRETSAALKALPSRRYACAMLSMLRVAKVICQPECIAIVFRFMLSSLDKAKTTGDMQLLANQTKSRYDHTGRERMLINQIKAASYQHLCPRQ